MNKIFRNKAILAVIIPLFILGCSTTQVSTAYKIDADTVTIVDTAMQAYGNLFRAGLIPPAIETKVQTAYGIYQKAMLVNISATQALVAVQAQANASSSDLASAQAAANTALAEASSAVVNLFVILQSGGVPSTVLSPVLAPPTTPTK